jgi:hypothetical protein
MPLFFYVAHDDQGQEVRGTIEAISVQAARAALREKEVEVKEIHEATMNELRSTQYSSSITLEDSPSSTEIQSQKSYYPFVDTLRLYAGWLLAWYSITYVFGAYQYTKDIPIRIPYAEALLPPFSDIVFSFTIASFLFLLLSSLQKSFGGGTVQSFVFTILGIVLFSLYRVNV